MEEDDKGCPMIRMGVSGRVFLLVAAYLSSPGPTVVCVYVLRNDINKSYYSFDDVVDTHKACNP